MTGAELIDLCYARRHAGVPYDDDPIVVTPDEYRAIVWLAQTELGIKAWQLRQPIEGPTGCSDGP